MMMMMMVVVVVMITMIMDRDRLWWQNYCINYTTVDDNISVVMNDYGHCAPNSKVFKSWTRNFVAQIKLLENAAESEQEKKKKKKRKREKNLLFFLKNHG